MGFSIDVDLSNIPSMDMMVGQDVAAGVNIDAAIAAALGELNIPSTFSGPSAPDFSGLATTEQLAGQESSFLDMLTSGFGDIRSFVGEQIGNLSSMFGGQFENIWSTISSNQQAVQSGTLQQTQDIASWGEGLGRQIQDIESQLGTQMSEADMSSFINQNMAETFQGNPDIINSLGNQMMGQLMGGEFGEAWSSFQAFADAGAFAPQDQPTPEGMTSAQITDLVNSIIAGGEGGAIGGQIEQAGLNQPGFTPGLPVGEAPATSFAPPARRYEDWAYNLGYFPQPQAFGEQGGNLMGTGLRKQAYGGVF